MNFLKKITHLGREKQGDPAVEAKCEEPDISSLQVEEHGVSKEDEENRADAGEGRTNLFKLVQSKIGMDVSQGITLPVWLFEPTSTLQRMTEMLHFAELLDHAALLESSVERAAYIGVFFATGFNGTERFFKPFNPILGETFEFIDPKTGFKFISEQVSHHPPISATHAESDNFLVSQEAVPKTVFLGNSLDLNTGVRTHIVLKRTNDHFLITRYPKTRLHNLLIGRTWIDHYGDVTIENLTTRDSVTISFEKCGFLSRGRHELHGQAIDSTGKVSLEINGKWNKTISITWLVDGSETRGTQKVVWERPSRNAISKFKLTEFVFKLNEMDDNYERLLPPTDTRLRPDRRYLDKGDGNLAGVWKNRMEEKQRTDRKQREKKLLEDWTPKWFQLAPEPGTADQMMWQYVGGYWEEREKKQAALLAGSPEAQDIMVARGVRGLACDFRSLQ